MVMVGGDNYINLKYTNTRAAKFIQDNGKAETLNGTDNFLWVAYFAKTDLTICMEKKSSLIKNAVQGKVENLKPIEDGI